MRIAATRAGFLRGARATLPLTVGLLPFGLVVGVLAQAQGLSALEQAAMSALVFAGASQILALELWTDPAPIASATLAAVAVNLRFALMGPALAPWIDAVRGWRRWLMVGTIVDHAWALAIAEMRAGRHAAFPDPGGVEPPRLRENHPAPQSPNHRGPPQPERDRARAHRAPRG